MVCTEMNLITLLLIFIMQGVLKLTQLYSTIKENKAKHNLAVYSIEKQILVEECFLNI